MKKLEQEKHLLIEELSKLRVEKEKLEKHIHYLSEDLGKERCAKENYIKKYLKLKGGKQ